MVFSLTTMPSLFSDRFSSEFCRRRSTTVLARKRTQSTSRTRLCAANAAISPKASLTAKENRGLLRPLRSATNLLIIFSKQLNLVSCCCRQRSNYSAVYADILSIRSTNLLIFGQLASAVLNFENFLRGNLLSAGLCVPKFSGTEDRIPHILSQTLKARS